MGRLNILEGIEVVDRYETLQKALKFIIINSNSNTAPYHNLNHLLVILKFCYEGLKVEGFDVENEGEVMPLLLAAIFHDVNHTAGEQKDKINVAIAKDSVSEFISTQNIDIDTKLVCEIIDATEYPYVIPGNELTPLQAIIRDADLLQTTEPNWIHQVILGLSKEMNIRFFDLMVGQRKFLESAEFNTEWGKDMKKLYWPSVMKQFEMLERVNEKIIK